MSDDINFTLSVIVQLLISSTESMLFTELSVNSAMNKPAPLCPEVQSEFLDFIFFFTKLR